MLIDKNKSCLLVIDMQERLLPKMLNRRKILQNTKILIQSANILKIPVLLSEQYPKGLGNTAPEIKKFPYSKIIEKTTFSCGKSKKFLKILKSLNRPQIIVVGIEAHVCVLQTAADLKNMNYDPFVVLDAISSRAKHSKDIANKRLGDYGCNLVSTEMVVFEWIEDSKNQKFKIISQLVS